MINSNKIHLVYMLLIINTNFLNSIFFLPLYLEARKCEQIIMRVYKLKNETIPITIEMRFLLKLFPVSRHISQYISYVVCEIIIVRT